ncbi:prepilin-type N-terminal cleavage/methylation domain-containing protein [Leptolyngbya sp. ST-U4]|uniref:prepilin-type N-terminal cleavage/methylation domain-containing protein n=1 Tax=Leptolyngbya sp. ST-U4 TaxID=2933912 RepID=UPI00329A36A2
MARRFLLSRLKRLLIPQAKPEQINSSRAKSMTPQGKLLPIAATPSNRGFTLLELLVVAVIGGGLVSGLMFIVVQLMQADQRESARTETQREMQLAMDYISNELREAVFVYTGEYMPTLTQHLPASLIESGKVPILAFWKYQPFPDAVKAACVSANPPAGVGCMSGQSYALVVYSLERRPASGTPWRGGARITRYALTQFEGNSTTITNGYVNPGDEGNFATWPSMGGVNLQTAAGGRPAASSGTINTLVDYVDGQTTFNTTVRCPGDDGTAARKPYSLSPPDSMLSVSSPPMPRSFYACVISTQEVATVTGTQNLQTVGEYQDVVLYLRGSAVGRPGISTALSARSAELLPTLETRVLLRGVLTRQP